jgi:hypothetical protein
MSKLSGRSIQNTSKEPTKYRQKHLFLSGVFIFVCLVVYTFTFSELFGVHYSRADGNSKKVTKNKEVSVPVFDRVAYDKKMLANANLPQTVGTSTQSSTTLQKWPVKAPYPNAGAILPFKRIIAYYGNFYSTKMGVLGEYPEDVMLAKLRAEVAKWEAADPTTPVVPAIDYIAITAQGSPGRDGMYRFRMPPDQIQIALDTAKKANGIVILEMQIGLSDIRTELPLLAPYLKLPQVHLALDPEFSMRGGAKPGTVIGSFDASEINYVSNYMATLVRENNLPPKVLVIHRFTQNMVTNDKLIKPLPEVQILMDMDGWGSPAKKLNTYQRFVADRPVQFTGFKLFYKNDLKPPSTRILTPQELLKLSPQPLFIQFQ